MSAIYWHLLTFSLFIYFAFAQISDKRLCVDPKCSSPVSLAKTIGRYFSPDTYRLSFAPNQDILIYSKSAGSDESLWGGEINGKRGYIPKIRVREIKKFATPELLVDTETIQTQVPLKEKIVTPSKVEQNFEVIDKTTIYMSADVDVGKQDATIKTSLQYSDSTKIDPPIDNDHIAEGIDVSTNNHNFEGIKATGELEVIESTKAGSIIETESSYDKLELDYVLTESAINSSTDLNITQGVTVNIGQNNIVQSNDLSTESQQTEEIENNDINTSTANIRGDTFINKEKNKLHDNSDEKLQVQEVIKNPFVPNAENSDKVKDQSLSIEEPDEKEYRDDKLNVSNLEKNKPKEQLIEANISSIRNPVFNEGSPPDIAKPESSIDNIESLKTEKNSSNSVVGDIQNVPSNSENFSSENWNAIEKSQEATGFQSNENVVSKEGSEIQTESPLIIIKPTFSESKNDFYNARSPKMEMENMLGSEVQNNSPLITEQPITSKLVNTESDLNNAQSTEMKVENAVPNVVSEVQKNSPLITESTSTKSVNTETDIDTKSTTLKMENQNEIGVESNISIISGNSSVEINSRLSSENEDIIAPAGDTQEESNILKDKTASRNEEFLSTHSQENKVEKGTDNHQYIETTPYYDNVSKEENNIQDNNDHIHSSEPVDSNGYEENIEGEKIHQETILNETPNIFSYLDHTEDVKHSDNDNIVEELVETNADANFDVNVEEGDFCMKENCPNRIDSKSSEYFMVSMDLLNFSSDIFLYLVTTAVSVIVFLLGHFALDKSRREGPLLLKINKLEKEFLILLKEKEILAEQVKNKKKEEEHVVTEEFLNLQQEKEMLEEKVQNLEDNMQTLEKELENSTEVGLELNRMLSEVLNSENAGQTLMLNIEGLQAQLAEQQGIVSSMKEVLSLKETENHELNLELDIANKKVADLQNELDKLLSNIIKLEEDKESLEKNSESQMVHFKSTIGSLHEELESTRKEYTKKIEALSDDLSTSEHKLQLKTKEYEGLKSSMQQIKDIKNANTLESLLEVNSIKAELEQLKTECQGHCDRLRKEKETNSVLEKKVRSTEEQIDVLKIKFEETDKTKLELETKLQVLTNYFKEKEEQLQKELSKYESMWSAKQGEATSTSERIKYLQSEVQSYKAQNETLKQEIVSQEVELKGQISVLEKKVHENWVSARQAERRLEELKQEAAQLRNRLTLRERALQEDRLHNRMQSPLEQSGDLPISPLHLESPASPPLLYNSRDHITKSPPILGMPPPFLPPPTGSSYLPPPPPTGASYLPPPLPFMPPPPHDMFPGDHRPPPLGRMSSPPLNSRYSPNRPYSPYDRSPSPSYDESEYGTSPVHRRNYSQFNRRRDHRPAAMEKFNGRSGTLSSGSENSNESLEEINHQNSKV